jgi:signal peptidase I
MMPTLQIGDRLIVDLTYYAKQTPQRGDLPVFIFPEDKSKDFIQRVIGLPGETVEIRDKKVFVNGRELSEPWAVQLDEDNVGAKNNFGPKVVPQGEYFFLGDNRDHSYDSRFWGFVDRASIKGKALYLYWAKDKGRIGVTIQ